MVCMRVLCVCGCKSRRRERVQVKSEACVYQYVPICNVCRIEQVQIRIWVMRFKLEADGKSDKKHAYVPKDVPRVAGGRRRAPRTCC